MITEDQLDHAVAEALNWKIVTWGDKQVYVQADGEGRFCCNVADWKPSTNPAQAWPIQEREKIGVFHSIMEDEWISIKDKFTELEVIVVGPTPLIAVMRCFVAAKAL